MNVEHARKLLEFFGAEPQEEDSSKGVDHWLEEDWQITEYEIVGDYFLGKFRVMYGWRLRAGKLFSGFCDIDLCCGDSAEAYKGAYRLYKKVMERNLEQSRPIFDGLPTITEIKPYYNDPSFMRWYNNLAEEQADD